MADLTDAPSEIEISEMVAALQYGGPEMLQCRNIIRRLAFQRGQLLEQNDQLNIERSDLTMLLRRVLRKMKQYEMDVDVDPPNHHRKLMTDAIKRLKQMGYLTPIKG